jgi:cytochrome c oxidase cbb3-type subunit I/II
MAMLGVPYDAQALGHADAMAKQQAETVGKSLAAAGGPKGLQTKDVIALIAYLQRLGRDIQLEPQGGVQ